MHNGTYPYPGSQQSRRTRCPPSASLGYRQELQRTLGLFSNFAVAFSYISVSTGAFALFALGIPLRHRLGRPGPCLLPAPAARRLSL